jgi:hypothetical protein
MRTVCLYILSFFFPKRDALNIVHVCLSVCLSVGMTDRVKCFECTEISSEFAALVLSADFYTLKMEAVRASEVAIRLNRITSLNLLSVIVVYFKITNL